jgi:hypothetical protein
MNLSTQVSVFLNASSVVMVSTRNKSIEVIEQSNMASSGAVQSVSVVSQTQAT